MREIIFRAKRVDNGEWVEGYYLENAIGKHIGGVIFERKVQIDGLEFTFVWHKVNPETVGQFTGLIDKNGMKIFEGDIVRGIAYSSEWIGVIVWIDEIASFGLRHGHDIAWENCTILKRAAKGMHDEFTAEVIGNIHDNPELVEVV